MTLRRLWVLYGALPRVNLVSVAQSRLDPEARDWGTEAHLLASVFDAVQALNYTTRCANTPKGKGRPKAPKPHPRPKRRKSVGDWFAGKTIYAGSAPPNSGG